MMMMMMMVAKNKCWSRDKELMTFKRYHNCQKRWQARYIFQLASPRRAIFL
jgi:hypothetical protein